MKICIMIMIVAMTLIGCIPAQVQVDRDSKEVIAKITARHVGYEIQKKYPDVAKEVLAISKEILIAKDDIIATSVKSLTSVLINKITEDPLLLADINNVLDLIKVDVDVEVSDEQMRIIKAIAGGLVSGIEIGHRLCRNVEDINIKIGQ